MNQVNARAKLEFMLLFPPGWEGEFTLPFALTITSRKVPLSQSSIIIGGGM